MAARPRRRRALSSPRIHSLWLTTLIGISVVLLVIGFVTDTQRASHDSASVPLRVGASGPWLAARQVASLPAAVQDAAAAPIPNEGALLLGGLDSSQTSQPSIELAGPDRNNALGKLAIPLHDAAAAAVGGSVYLFGGGQVSSYTAITQVNPSTGRARSAGQLPEPRSDLAAATLGHTVYLVGGFTGIKAVSSILAFTPGSKPTVVGVLPKALRYASVAGIDGQLVIAGGIGPQGPTSSIETFDPRTGKVTQLGNLPDPVSHAPAVTLGRYVYVIGGRAANNAPTREVFAIDPRKGTVSLAGHLPVPLSDAAAAPFRTGALVAGGNSTSGTVRDVFELTPAPRPRSMLTTALLQPGSDPSVLPADVLIADHHNNRLLLVTPRGQVTWSFPHPGDLSRNQHFRVPDDAFYTPDGRGIIATEEDYFVISLINVAKRRITWRYGHPGTAGYQPDFVWNPDDAIMAPNGRIYSADIKNCRLIELQPPLLHTIAQMGTTQVCGHNPPAGFGSPNGAFPTTGGGIVVTEITGDWVDVFNRSGQLTSSFNPPGFTYPSDTNEVRPGVYLSVDYTKPGSIEMLSSQGHVMWSFAPSGPDALNHPSLALPLPNGDVLANDDYNNRVIVVNPHTNQIVWQFGHTGVCSSRPGYLCTPDGVDLAPPYSLADRFPDARGLPVKPH